MSRASAAFAAAAVALEWEVQYGYACMLGSGDGAVIVHCVGVDLSHVGGQQGRPLCDECAALPVVVYELEPAARVAPADVTVRPIAAPTVIVDKGEQVFVHDVAARENERAQLADALAASGARLQGSTDGPVNHRLGRVLVSWAAALSRALGDEPVRLAADGFGRRDAEDRERLFRVLKVAADRNSLPSLTELARAAEFAAFGKDGEPAQPYEPPREAREPVVSGIWSPTHGYGD